MRKYKIKLDSSYDFDSFEIEAINIMHAISLIVDSFRIDRIIEIKLID